MKKIFSVIALVLVFIGCGSEDDGTSFDAKVKTIYVSEVKDKNSPYAVIATAGDKKDSIGIITKKDSNGNPIESTAISYFNNENNTSATLILGEDKLPSFYIDDYGKIEFNEYYDNGTVKLSFYDLNSNFIKTITIAFDTTIFSELNSSQKSLRAFLGWSANQWVHIGGTAISALTCGLSLAGGAGVTVATAGAGAIAGAVVAGLGCGNTAYGILKDSVDLYKHGDFKQDANIADDSIKNVGTLYNGAQCAGPGLVNIGIGILNKDASVLLAGINHCKGGAIEASVKLLDVATKKKKEEEAAAAKTPNESPMAVAKASKQSADGTINFTSTDSWDLDGDIKSYQWSDGSSILSNKPNFSKSNFTAGTHRITLTVMDNKGATDSDTVIITVAKKVKESIDGVVSASDLWSNYPEPETCKKTLNGEHPSIFTYFDVNQGDTVCRYSKKTSTFSILTHEMPKNGFYKNYNVITNKLIHVQKMQNGSANGIALHWMYATDSRYDYVACGIMKDSKQVSDCTFQ